MSENDKLARKQVYCVLPIVILAFYVGYLYGINNPKTELILAKSNVEGSMNGSRIIIDGDTIQVEAKSFDNFFSVGFDKVVVVDATKFKDERGH